MLTPRLPSWPDLRRSASRERHSALHHHQLLLLVCCHQLGCRKGRVRKHQCRYVQPQQPSRAAGGRKLLCWHKVAEHLLAGHREVWEQVGEAACGGSYRPETSHARHEMQAAEAHTFHSMFACRYYLADGTPVGNGYTSNTSPCKSGLTVIHRTMRYPLMSASSLLSQMNSCLCVCILDRPVARRRALGVQLCGHPRDVPHQELHVREQRRQVRSGEHRLEGAPIQC